MYSAGTLTDSTVESPVTLPGPTPSSAYSFCDLWGLEAWPALLPSSATKETGVQERKVIRPQGTTLDEDADQFHPPSSPHLFTATPVPPLRPEFLCENNLFFCFVTIKKKYIFIIEN